MWGKLIFFIFVSLYATTFGFGIDLFVPYSPIAQQTQRGLLGKSSSYPIMNAVEDVEDYKLTSYHYNGTRYIAHEIAILATNYSSNPYLWTQMQAFAQQSLKMLRRFRYHFKYIYVSITGDNDDACYVPNLLTGIKELYDTFDDLVVKTDIYKKNVEKAREVDAYILVAERHARILFGGAFLFPSDNTTYHYSYLNLTETRLILLPLETKPDGRFSHYPDCGDNECFLFDFLSRFNHGFFVFGDTKYVFQRYGIRQLYWVYGSPERYDEYVDILWYVNNTKEFIDTRAPVLRKRTPPRVYFGTTMTLPGNKFTNNTRIIVTRDHYVTRKHEFDIYGKECDAYVETLDTSILFMLPQFLSVGSKVPPLYNPNVFYTVYEKLREAFPSAQFSIASYSHPNESCPTTCHFHGIQNKSGEFNRLFQKLFLNTAASMFPEGSIPYYEAELCINQTEELTKMSGDKPHMLYLVFFSFDENYVDHLHPAFPPPRTCGNYYPDELKERLARRGIIHHMFYVTNELLEEEVRLNVESTDESVGALYLNTTDYADAKLLNLPWYLKHNLCTDPLNFTYNRFNAEHYQEVLPDLMFPERWKWIDGDDD